ITPTMARPATLLRPQRDTDFSLTRYRLGLFDHELGRKFHTAGPKAQTIVQLFCEAPHSAIHISNSRAEKQVHDCRHDWRTDITMVPGHCAILDLSAEAIAHY